MTAPDVARALPDIPTLRDRCRSMAMLDAILQPDKPFLRRHTFDTRWSATQELASMDNGGGDAYDIVFSAAGAYVRGFDHVSPMNAYAGDGEPWPGLFDVVPEVFRSCVDEPKFHLDGVPLVTVCLWRETGEPAWATGDVTCPDDPGSDGSGWLFGLLTDGSPEAYGRWAEGYYGRPVDPGGVRDVYELRPLTPDLVRGLHPGVTPAQLQDAVESIGYPRG
ncbi:hypothetical protein [Streptomyces sp. NPDC060035]|uniref:hypothetical protein n=1 Tax=Streptomyces sp. NPDC060035 TaxID=3347044 RepID=UPI0036B7F459